MNRKTFLASLFALPAAIKAACTPKPTGPKQWTTVFDRPERHLVIHNFDESAPGVPIIIEPRSYRWMKEDGVIWYQIKTDQGWRKMSFIGDNVEAPDRSERYAALNLKITQDWQPK